MRGSRDFFKHYDRIKSSKISGRFVDYPKLQVGLKDLKKEYTIREIGRSFLHIPIQSIQFGSGSKKILAWSQMHGNETTTTKGILDLLNFFTYFKNEEPVKKILKECTLLIIPMLNPDGAARYTRENVNKVDLNRDAYVLKEPESKVLRECFENFQPDFCLNLHDQRTIFAAGNKNLPATLSFLAPSMDEDRTITGVRKEAMKIIVVMNRALQKVIPGQVGRFDDAFNLNCSGDYFQNREVPTILFECGHYPNDYLREETRKYFTYSLFQALHAIATGDYLQENEGDYFSIPENEKNFRDVILRNAFIKGELVDVAIQFKEKMKAGEVQFAPEVEAIGEKLKFFGHLEIDCKGQEVKKTDKTILSENDIVEEILLNKEKFSIKSPDIP